MGTVVFEGAKPFALVMHHPPTTTAEGRIVVVTLPVLVPEFPQSTADIQVRMTMEHAAQIAAQIQAALVTAKANQKAGRY
jgi:hypothetical protein